MGAVGSPTPPGQPRALMPKAPVLAAPLSDVDSLRHQAIFTGPLPTLPGRPFRGELWLLLKRVQEHTTGSLEVHLPYTPVPRSTHVCGPVAGTSRYHPHASDATRQHGRQRVRGEVHRGHARRCHELVAVLLSASAHTSAITQEDPACEAGVGAEVFIPELLGARRGRGGRQAAGLGPPPEGVAGPPVLIAMTRGAVVRGRVCAQPLTHTDSVLFHVHCR